MPHLLAVCNPFPCCIGEDRRAAPSTHTSTARSTEVSRQQLPTPRTVSMEIGHCRCLFQHQMVLIYICEIVKEGPRNDFTEENPLRPAGNHCWPSAQCHSSSWPTLSRQHWPYQSPKFQIHHFATIEHIRLQAPEKLRQSNDGPTHNLKAADALGAIYTLPPWQNSWTWVHHLLTRPAKLLQNILHRNHAFLEWQKMHQSTGFSSKIGIGYQLRYPQNTVHLVCPPKMTSTHISVHSVNQLRYHLFPPAYRLPEMYGLFSKVGVLPFH